MKGTILIVDDEVQITENLKIILRKHAGEILVSNNPHHALELIRNNKIHCVISDIYMPEMSGFELIKLVREHNIDVPFIFFSASEREELKAEASKYNHATFVTKPSIPELVKMLGPMLQLGLDL